MVSVESVGQLIPLVGTRFALTTPAYASQADLDQARAVASELARAIKADEPIVIVLPYGYTVVPLPDVEES